MLSAAPRVKSSTTAAPLALTPLRDPLWFAYHRLGAVAGPAATHCSAWSASSHACRRPLGKQRLEPVSKQIHPPLSAWNNASLHSLSTDRDQTPRITRPFLRSRSPGTQRSQNPTKREGQCPFSV